MNNYNKINIKYQAPVKLKETIVNLSILNMINKDDYIKLETSLFGTCYVKKITFLEEIQITMQIDTSNISNFKETIRFIVSHMKYMLHDKNFKPIFKKEESLEEIMEYINMQTIEEFSAVINSGEHRKIKQMREE